MRKEMSRVLTKNVMELRHFSPHEATNREHFVNRDRGIKVLLLTKRYLK